MFKREKIAVTTIAAAKPTVKKLLIILTNAVLEKKEKNKQDVSIKKI